MESLTSTTYISIDVATRSLAIGVYRMRSFANLTSQAPTASADPLGLDAYLDSLVVPLSMNVYDINEGAKVKETTGVAKAGALKEVLTKLDADIASHIIDTRVVVVIEYQMNANHSASAIFNMIVYHYAGRHPVEVIKPSWKNTVSLHPSLTHSAFLGYCSSNYAANKQHTKFNMLYFLAMTDHMDMITCIAKKNWDDIADTLMQALAYQKKSKAV